MKEHYAEQYNILEQQTKNLLRHRFGSCSERFVEENHPQDDLFLCQRYARCRGCSRRNVAGQCCSS